LARRGARRAFHRGSHVSFWFGEQKVRAQNAKSGAGDQFGVSLGDIRVLAKKIRTDRWLCRSLWGARHSPATRHSGARMRWWPQDLRGAGGCCETEPE
jgi:hypothetical protein